jgi:geranylgeranyl reductase family protein
MIRDVVIVGAGPAGAVAAAGLARRGRDVLVLDRSSFPRDKVCGDGIPPGTVELLGRVGMGETIREAGFHRVDRIRVVAPSGRAWEAGFRPRRPGLEFYIAPRARFDALVLDHALACGASFRRSRVGALLRDGARVSGVVTADGERIKARVTIGADGATSVVARELGVMPWPRGRRDVAIRGYADGFETAPRAVEFFLLRPLLPGYGWVFPLGGRRANVGVIVSVDSLERSRGSLANLLDQFLASEAMRGRADGTTLSSVASWQLPLAAAGGPGRAFDGAILAGDAGGFVDPLTGEGIHTAVLTGTIAAEVVDAALERTPRGSLTEYDTRCVKEMGRLIRRSERCRRWLAGVPAALESLVLLANASPRLFRGWLNHVSTDFELLD